MTPNTIKELIKDTLASVLPPLLATAGLLDFAEYKGERPFDVEKRTLSVYIDSGRNSTNEYSVSFIIHCQLPGINNEFDYNDVIYQAIVDNITEVLVGMESRDFIEFDLWPLDQNSGTSFCFYNVGFIDSLDDCS